MIFRTVILPTSLLAGAIIGAGIFALPYVFEKAGILTGLFYLVIFSAVFALIHLMYADIIIRTKENRRFFGYARIYLGDPGKWLAILVTIIGMLFILTVYLALSISFFNLLFPTIPDIYKVLIFWFFGSLAVFLGVGRLAVAEFLILVGLVAIILIVFCFGLPGFKQTFAAPLFNPGYLFVPYGAILFSLGGRTAIPTLLGYFRKNNESRLKAKKPIILGSVIPALVYLIFVLGVLGLSETVSEDSVTGLIGRLPFPAIGLLGILGLVSLWSTYIVIGRDIKKSFEHDLNLRQNVSGLIVAAVPVFLHFSGFQNFLELVELAGGIFMGLEAILIILIWRKAEKISAEECEVFIKKLNPLVVCALVLVFVGGIIYSVF